MPISPPVQITVPFATSGLKNTIPANTNNVTGNAGYDAGFGSINMTPKTAGGIPPFGQDFNGIFFDISTALQFLEAGGSFPYSSSFATAVGGYPIGAIVSRTDSTGLWRNTVANNTTNPETFGAGWQPEDAGLIVVSMTNANVTLTALQASRSIIVIQGALVANLQLIFPTYTKQWIIVNSTTGAFSITAKTAAGSGVTVPQGTSQSVWGDGASIIMSGSGRLIGTQVFSASGTYTPTAGTKFIIAEGVGGGGAGGGAPATAGTTGSVGSGGNSGAFGRGIFFSGFSGAAITIGGGGTPASGANGGSGGNTSLGALMSIPGGVGGGASVAAVPPILAGSSAGAAAPTGANLVAAGGNVGHIGLVVSLSTLLGGLGAASAYGGGAASLASGLGQVGTAPGSGGGGSANTSSQVAKSGGAGMAGIITIYEYA